MKLATIKTMRNEINRDWFKGDLLELPIYFKRSRLSWGSFNGQSITIERGMKFSRLFGFLIHEMFHQFQNEILKCKHEHGGCYTNFRLFIMESTGVDIADRDLEMYFTRSIFGRKL
jgi:hypothetical protein